MGEAEGMILIVDDEEPIRNAVSRKLQAEGYICAIAVDGKEALWKAFMQDFDVILLDIKMPGLSGMEVLSRIARDHPDIGVIMITAIGDSQTAVEAMKLGAYDYVTKPFNLDDLVMRVNRALERRTLLMETKDYQIRLEQRVEKQTRQIQECYGEAMQALAREEIALGKLSTSSDGDEQESLDGVYMQMARVLAQMGEMHEPYARGHAERVALLANEIAQQLGCSDDMVRNIRLAATLHDIGKIVIPDHILFKPGSLTSAEYSEVKRHPMAAVDIIRQVENFKDIIPLVESHHEWYNGKGYPGGLKGENIPLGARILAVADSYDAMTCPRPYRTRLSNEEAVHALKKGANTQWDLVIVDALLKILKRESKMLETALLEI
jgi:response regulator RpfG family c-di-GMP phosphodiesterase